MSSQETLELRATSALDSWSARVRATGSLLLAAPALLLSTFSAHSLSEWGCMETWNRKLPVQHIALQVKDSI